MKTRLRSSREEDPDSAVGGPPGVSGFAVALGDRCSLIVIRDLMFGNRRHFRELLTRSEERIASNILADRLTRLEKA